MKLKSIVSFALAAASCAASAASAPLREVTVCNDLLTSLDTKGGVKIAGAGGVVLPSLEMSAGDVLALDPISTPVRVEAAPQFAKGAKIALDAAYREMSLGRVVLMSYNGKAELPEGLFDASSVARGASCSLDQAAAPDGRLTQLVLTVGDYEGKAKPILVLPMGDSITQGVQKENEPHYGFPQYRTAIAARLAANGYKPRTCGFWHYGKAEFDAAGVKQPSEWNMQCGVSGIRATGMGDKKKRDRWTKAGEPDVVTLLIGTNDIHPQRKNPDREAGAKAVYGAWKALVGQLAERWPKATIVGATILDRDFNDEGPVGRDLTMRVNAMIKADFAAGALPANFRLLDLFAEVPLGEKGNFFLDKLHPNWQGHAKMAKAFAGKILEEKGAVR